MEFKTFPLQADLILCQEYVLKITVQIKH